MWWSSIIQSCLRCNFEAKSLSIWMGYSSLHDACRPGLIHHQHDMPNKDCIRNRNFSVSVSENGACHSITTIIPRMVECSIGCFCWVCFLRLWTSCCSEVHCTFRRSAIKAWYIRMCGKEDNSPCIPPGGHLHRTCSMACFHRKLKKNKQQQDDDDDDQLPAYLRDAVSDPVEPN